MSRSGYCDDYDYDLLNLYRGAVDRAMQGKRGQALLRDLLSALDSLPVPELIAGQLEADGAVCALGAVGKARSLDMASLDPEDAYSVAAAFGIAPSLAREIVYMNDEVRSKETPAERFVRMRAWVAAQIKAPPT